MLAAKNTPAQGREAETKANAANAYDKGSLRKHSPATVSGELSKRE
jgi:hypothetical protein